MRRPLAALTFIAALGVGGALAEDTAPAADPQATPDAAQAETEVVLAEGEGGALTQKGVDAYISSLEFVLAQMGRPTEFEDAERTRIGDSLASHYPALPVEIQEDLANLPEIWSHYLQTWPLISPGAKRDFAFTVLTLAFGAERAAEAVGIELDEQPGTSTP